MSITCSAVAKVVLDNCMDMRKVQKPGSSQLNEITSDTEQYEVEFNFEFLEDYGDKHASEVTDKTDGTNASNEEEKNKGFAAKCGPKEFSRRKHPLALMVSLDVVVVW